MKTLSIQAEPERDAQFNEEEVLKSLRALGFEPEVKQGVDDDGRYINYYIDTDDLADAWQKVNANLISNPVIAKSCIVICHGDNGWDDLLFLHHYDPENQLDEL